MVNNDFNLFSYTGLDIVAMILRYSNEDFDFGPILEKTESHLFKDKDMKDWVL